MSDNQPRKAAGRAAQADPPNRFVSLRRTPDYEQLLADDEALVERRVVPTEVLPDKSQSIIAENDSPDVGFRYSVNAYRGCEHGCAYCYARPYHEYLGLGAGLDFETKILVKHDAPRLLRAELCRSSWKGDVVAMSGVTDCYQPLERHLRLTRGLLEVMLEARQCVGIVTKNALALRDIDLLAELARNRLVHVSISVTTLDAELARTTEPRTSTPAHRLAAVRALADAGIPTRVFVAPIIPGINDHEIPRVLAAAAEAGASGANYTLLRLPLSVLPVFQQWLSDNYPLKRELVESRIRATRDGELNDSQFGKRMRGAGHYAEQIAQTFRVFARRCCLDRPFAELDCSQFRPPRAPSGQTTLF